MTLGAYSIYHGWIAQLVQKKIEEDLRRGSTNGSTFTPLYNGIEDSYGVDSIGYYWVIGVLEGHTTPAGDTKVLRVPSIYNVSVCFIYRKYLSSVS